MHFEDRKVLYMCCFSVAVWSQSAADLCTLSTSLFLSPNDRLALLNSLQAQGQERILNTHKGIICVSSCTLALRPGRLKYGLVSIAWVIVHMRELSYPESGNSLYFSKPLS